MLKRNQLFVAALICLAAVIGGACNCGARLAIKDQTVVVFTAPADGSQYLASDTVNVTTTADNGAGLGSLAIMAGIQQITSCAASSPTDTHIDCPASFTPSTYASQTAGGQLILTAVGTSASGISVSASITIIIGPPFPDGGTPWFVAFLQPQTSNDFPPTATVSTPSTLQMGITGTPSTPITSILVTDEHNATVANFTTTPYSTTIAWLTVLGAGNHTLTAVATDRGGETKSVLLELTVAPSGCTSDATCPSGSRCCPNDGACHPVVAEGAACDCAHPCPNDQGCLPGTCGKLPQQCRPGCNPGSPPSDNPFSPVTLPDNCADINGVKAYCDPLPASQVTTQNKGGACRAGDNCDVVAQNCPDAPLDPTSDAGAPSNPIVAYTCEPAAVNGSGVQVNVCYPSGTHPPQPNSPRNTCQGEDQTCGSSIAGCSKGYLCVFEQGNSAAGPSCSAECKEPFTGGGFSCPPSVSDCPSGYYCSGLIGNGNEQFTTGVCTPMPQGC